VCRTADTIFKNQDFIKTSKKALEKKLNRFVHDIIEEGPSVRRLQYNPFLT
jgi:hypothetical protein